MDAFTILIIGIVVAFFWWLFSRGGSNKTTVTYTDPKTGKQKKEVRNKRRAQDRVNIDKPEPFEITDEIQEVLGALEKTNANIFLTGKAGTGKSTLLRYFRATTKKFPVVVAPTGVAAVNVQGQTIHSFFGFGISITPDRVRRVSFERAQIYRKMKMLIIDEISMVRADLFECVDKFLRLNTGKPDLPFGGVQIVLIGDLYQLPPVVTDTEKRFFNEVYDSPFFFSTEAFHKGDFKKFELSNVYRQKDEHFVQALNAVREGTTTNAHIDLLNTTVVEEVPDDLDDYVHLVTTNKMAKEINDSRMARLPSEPVTYKGTLFGTFTERDAPTEVELTLKAGAQVMLLNNDRARRWVNGDIVKILETQKDSVVVEFDDGTVEEVAPYSWETIRFVFDEEEQKIIPKKIGSFTQIPVKPAWAMTIHKAQGKTFEKVFIDLGSGAFAGGQTYVALSRCKSLKGLRLAGPLTIDDIFVNERVQEFMSFANPDVTPAPVTVRVKAATEPVKRIQPTLEEPSEEKLTKEEFVLQAVRKLRTGNYKGIHVVYSGFNEAFREYFNEDPVVEVQKLVESGVVAIRPVKGGVMLYDAKEYHSTGLHKQKQSNGALSKILDV